MNFLGRGGFGDVEKVEGPDGPLALKVIRNSPDSDRDFNEAKLLKKLKHPHVIKYDSCYRKGTKIYILMECAEGGNLQQYIGQCKSAGAWIDNGDGQTHEINRALRMIISLISTVYFIHDEGIVHRDLKPSNILISLDGKLKLCDFGLAKNVDASVARTNCGTQTYKAPEVLLGDSYTQECDIFSLGCVLYEIIVWRSAYTSQEQIANGSPPPFPNTSSFGVSKCQFYVFAACTQILGSSFRSNPLHRAVNFRVDLKMFLIWAHCIRNWCWPRPVSDTIEMVMGYDRDFVWDHASELGQKRHRRVPSDLARKVEWYCWPEGMRNVDVWKLLHTWLGDMLHCVPSISTILQPPALRRAPRGIRKNVFKEKLDYSSYY